MGSLHPPDADRLSTAYCGDFFIFSCINNVCFFAIVAIIFLSNMSVSEHETAQSRGRFPSYLRRQVNDLLCLLLQQRARRGRWLLQSQMLSPSLRALFLTSNHHRHSSTVLNSLFQATFHHYYSYDMRVRPTILFQHASLEDPVEELLAATFFQLSGFWPGQFTEVSENLLLIPDTIICPITRCRASKKLAIFLMLRRWNKADTWDDVARTLLRCRVWCIKIYRALFQLIAHHYRILVQVIDYCRIMPLLEDWSTETVHYSGCCPDVLFFTDGKPWKMARPERGEAAEALVRAAGGDDVNLVQQAYYNGHYGFSGAKVQHVLQADGICYSFTCPLRRHDAMVLQESSMLTMLSVLYVNNDPLRPVKYVTDKAYGRTRHL